MHKTVLIWLYLLCALTLPAVAQTTITVRGRVWDDAQNQPLPYAMVRVVDLALWGMSDGEGRFIIPRVPTGRQTLVVSYAGYVPRTITMQLTRDTDLKNLRLKENNLSLQAVEVTAQRRHNTGTTAYHLDRNTLDHHQMLNIKDVASLLPGGKTVNSTLTDDSRLALRAALGERGNASFGTAIEVDGVRLDNNAQMEETMATSTRSLSAGNVERIEVITGIPSVEYGDLSNGIVKVQTRQGKTPFIFEGSTNPYTKHASLSKGLVLPRGAGLLNLSLEHAQSYTAASSPHTRYQRNTLSLLYNKIFQLPQSTLNLRAGLTGGVGGYNSKADPDAFVNTYQRVRDNQWRARIESSWLHNSAHAGTFNLQLQGSVSLQDRKAESQTNANSSSAQPYLHTQRTGYALAQDYDVLLARDGNEAGFNSIVLGPVGYWYVKRYNDQLPLSVQFKLKGEWSKRWGKHGINRLMPGVSYQLTDNLGEGISYADMRYAPTWRPYVYRNLPSLQNWGFFLEDRLTIGAWQATVGMRHDLSVVRKSAYGRVGSLAPRAHIRYNAIRPKTGVRDRALSRLSLHAGYGKSIKLPSFQILYPQDSYTDRLVFTPGSTVDNKAYYAYHTQVEKAQYNPQLKWQYMHQIDVGGEATLWGAHLSLSAFYHRTMHPYQSEGRYQPFVYQYTSQSALEGLGIPSSERRYALDSETGQVHVNGIALPSTPYHTYLYRHQYGNGAPVTRYGLEWVLDLPQWHTLHTALRLDGNYYHYKGIDHTLVAGSAMGIGDVAATASSSIYPLVGYYQGSYVTSAGNTPTPSISNGALSRQANMNATLTTHIPKARLIITLKFEVALNNYKRNLSERRNTILLQAAGDVFGTPYQGQKDAYVALYPAYYSTWDQPNNRIPFGQALIDAYHTNSELYQQLTRLIVRANTPYFLNPQRISAYYSANFSVTKEIGRYLSLSFYANNFLNSMRKVRNSQTGLEQTLFNSGYIPKFYYGLSVRVKI